MVVIMIVIVVVVMLCDFLDLSVVFKELHQLIVQNTVSYIRVLLINTSDLINRKVIFLRICLNDRLKVSISHLYLFKFNYLIPYEIPFNLENSLSALCLSVFFLVKLLRELPFGILVLYILNK